MRRRAYLSMVAVLLAGCGGDGTGGSTQTPPQAPTETTTDTSTPTPTAADGSTPEPTETATAEPTPTPAQAPDAPLEAYEWWLTRAFEAYAPSGNTFGSVDSSVAVDEATVRSHLDEAAALRQELEGSNPTGDRKERFEELTGVYHFLDRTLSVHGHLRTAWNTQRDMYDVVVTQEGDPSGPFNAITTAADDAEAVMNTLIAKSDPTDTASFPPLLAGDYEDKVGQLSAEITAYRDLVSAFQGLNRAMGEAQRGVTHYEGESYTAASIAFNDAGNAFQSVANSFTANWPGHFEPTASDGTCVANGMAAGCKRMAEVSRAVADGQEEDPQAAKVSARSRFGQCEIVLDRVSIVTEFYA